jgi:magnesium chelatase accessory protein
MHGAPDWESDGRDWPHRHASRFEAAGGLIWHVQAMGQGPVLLLLHGTGAATHSWRALMPALAERFRVIAPDLPGHGFTTMPPRPQLSLEGMAGGICALVKELRVRPALIAGHSAGAAIAIRMALDGLADPSAIISLNGALLPFPGAGGHVFPALAKLLFLNPLTPRWFAWQAEERRAVERLIKGTGSTLDETGLDLYACLMRRRGHIAGALGMMAQWDLQGLKRDMPRLKPRLVLASSPNDKAVPPTVARDVAVLVPDSVLADLGPGGHLAHEVDPSPALAAIEEALRA